MLNRRLIRVKVLQAVYAYHQSEVKDKKSARAFLKKSIMGIEDTFINCVQFSNEFFSFVKIKFNPVDKHIQASALEMWNFQLLSGNSCLDVLINNNQTSTLFTKPSVNWTRDEDFLIMIYKEIIETPWFQEFSEDKSESFDKSQRFLVALYKYLIETSENFSTKMEEINIHWQDEKIPVLKSIEKLLKSFNDEHESPKIPVLSKDLADDIEYSDKLLEMTIAHHQEYEDMISARTPEWDSERIARIDLFIMIMALAEFMEFPSIPVKVTINEYLELAKTYSTPQSSKFINGILDKMLNELKKEGRVKKSGRGLVE